MGVPARHTPCNKPFFHLFGGRFGALMVLLCIFGFTGTAYAGDKCCKHKKGHMVRVPDISVKGPNISVSTPSVHVNKGGVSVNNQFSSFGGFAFGGGASSGGAFIISNGGGGGFIGASSTPTVISGLNVEAEAAAATEQVAVPYTETITKNRWTEDVYVLRAVCIDDKGVPHPASRPDPSDQVNPIFEGELFRCVAGTSMQVTLGKYANGQSQYDKASTIVCAKGEAIRHRPGGTLICAPQEPRRDCNERSLLRKFGPGVKVVRLRRMEQYTEQVSRTRYETRTVSAASAKASAQTTLVLNGGVGN